MRNSILWKTGAYTFVSAALSLTNSAMAQCPNQDHDCLTTGTPGCSDVDCCNAVCAVDSFCCAVAWDSICVGEAATICRLSVPCPPSDHDCFTTGGPGCTDTECCFAVCAFDPFCCQTAWDGICAQEAADNCAGAPPVNDECANRVP